MDYVITDRGIVLTKDGKPYTGYIRDCDWTLAYTRRRQMQEAAKSIFKTITAAAVACCIMLALVSTVPNRCCVVKGKDTACRPC